MKLRIAYAGIFTALALLASALILGNQRQTFADEVTPVPVDPCEDIFPLIPGMPGCDGDEGGDDVENPPVNPCDDVFPHVPNMPECGEDDDGGGGGGGGETPTDVCPNIDGDQTEVPSGKVLEGGECVDAPAEGGGGGSDTTTSGGSSGGGGGGGGGGSVLGTTTASTQACDAYITTFMRQGQQNDPEQVKRMQGILKDFEGADVEETGEYDAKSVAAINAFQLKYADEVLTPWGIKAPTGYVFLTTRKKLNEVYCKNTSFPLTIEEQQHIELVKKASIAKPVAPAKVVQEKQIEMPKAPVATTSVSKEPTPVTGNRISDFFRRLLNRFR
ncbi:MAG: hypothetical protein A2854_00165 [Parcubacteria group bacterium RIFCSPHIGHO2_01_FULL_56_18]|nr:MAG: hypothetical protein A2854_00165 [Parcubacteria group bacterium RIFCSPHIGHO2_01_FULL_56_18]